jgi:aspartate--ammonia ligase
MATTFDPDDPLAGLPPKELLEKGYTPTIPNLLEKEEALLYIKTEFENKLKANVNLQRVSAPLFLTKRSGFNDNLNGTERPATFAPRDFQDVKLEVPFSLAKWKRWALHYYGVKPGSGIVTDFRGLRCDVSYYLISGRMGDYLIASLLFFFCRVMTAVLT